MKKKLKTLFFAFFSVFAFASVAKAKMFDVSEFYLDNKMKVIVIPNHKAPIIKHMVWYQVGSLDEVLGKSGKAHLLEHLLFRGTKKIKDGEFNEIVERNGGNSNAFTSFDYTAYHQTLDISKLELAMFLEADRMQNLSISEEAFEKERGIVFQERKQVIESNPFGGFMEYLRRSFWQEHPYGRPIIGTDEEILSLTRKDVLDFYESFYAPNNAILILSGDIDAQTAKQISEKYYGKIKEKKLAERPKIKNSTKEFSSKIQMSIEDINSPRFIKLYKIDSYNTNKKDIYANIVLSKILGEGETSKLYKDLVVKQKSALSVGSSANVFARSYGTFSFSFTPIEGFDVNQIEQTINVSVEKAISNLSEEDVKEAKEKILSGIIYMRDNPNDAAYIFGSMASIGMSAEEINVYDENISQVTFEQVKKVADDLMKNKQSIVGIVTPKEVKQ